MPQNAIVETPPLWDKLTQVPQHLVRSAFRSLRHRNYRLFFIGQLISLIGTWLQNTALAWLVYSLTKDAMMLGVMSFLGSVPVLFLSVLAGTMADEYPKRRILIVTQISAGVQAILLAIAIWTHSVTVIVIGSANLVLGIITAFDLPTRQAFVVEMTSKEDVTNAVALNSAIFNTARLIGPAFAAYIIYALSLDMCFFLNGISYIAVIIGLMMMRFDRVQMRKRTTEVTRIGAMKEGIAYLYSVPQLRTLMFLVIGMTLFGWSYTVNLPVVAGHLLHGGASTYSALLSANGAGALLAALSQAVLAGKLDTRKTLFTSLVVFILSLLGLSFVHSLAASVVLLVLIGWGLITFFITANTTLQRRAPDELRGRIMSIYSFAFAGLVPFASLLSGWVASQFGVAAAFQMSALFLTCFAILGFLFFRKLPRLSAITREESIRELLVSEQEVIEAEQISRG